MHPAFDAVYPGVDVDPPSSLLGGEALLAKVYDAIRSSATPGWLERIQHAADGQLRRARRDLRSHPAAARPASRSGCPGRTDGLCFRPVGGPRARDRHFGMDPGTGRRHLGVPEHVGFADPSRALAARRSADRPRCRRAGHRPGAVPGHPAAARGLARRRPAARCLRSIRRPCRRTSRCAALSKAALCAVLELGKGLGLRVPELDKDEDVLRADGLGHHHRVLRGPVPAPARAVAAP